MISVLIASVPFRRVNVSGERFEEGDMPMRRTEYHGDFASLEILRAYRRKTLKRFTDSAKDLTGLPTLDEQDALMAEEEKVFAAEPVVAAVHCQ